MATKDYLSTLNTQVRKNSLKLTMLQEKKIMQLYNKMGEELLNEFASFNSSAYQKKILAEKINFYNKQVEGIIQEYAELQAANVVSAQMKVFQDVFKEYKLDRNFLNKIGNIDKTCVDYIIKGGLYSNGKGISERLWNYGKVNGQNIQDIIIQGKLAGMGAVNMAKLLQAYAKSPNSSAWKNATKKLGASYAYKITKAGISYEAMRLARTTIAHTAQVSLMASTKLNPFVDGLKWHTSNSDRVCRVCRDRDGIVYKKEEVPFDHPNGMCYQTAVITKSPEEIGKEVRDWMEGGKNPDLDKWANEMKKVAGGNTDKLITPKIDTTPKIKEYKSYIEKQDLFASDLTTHGKEFVTTLSKIEYQALQDYTGSFYKDMNNQLRSGEDLGEGERIKYASQALKKFTLREDLTVFRGTDLRVIEDLFDNYDDFMNVYEKLLLNEADDEYVKNKFVGGTLVDKGFMSTSAYKGGKFDKDVTYYIQLDKGTNYGAYINALSNYEDTECEFLLDSNLLTEIVDAKVGKDGKLDLYLKVLGYAE